MEISSGYWDFSIRKDESSGMRLIRFEAKLNELLPVVDVIAFETVSAGTGVKSNFDAVRLQTKLQAIIESTVERVEGLEHVGYNPQTIKAHALTGREGKRDKAAMIESAQEEWPDQEIIDDNQADALWLLDLAWTEVNQGDWI